MTWNGWAGRILRVDLATGRITTEELSYQKARDFIGCRGLNVAYLYDEVGPEVGPFDQGNKLIFGAGPLEGTPIGMGRVSILTKHPNRFLGRGWGWRPLVRGAEVRGLRLAHRGEQGRAPGVAAHRGR